MFMSPTYLEGFNCKQFSKLFTIESDTDTADTDTSSGWRVEGPCVHYSGDTLTGLESGFPSRERSQRERIPQKELA